MSNSGTLPRIVAGVLLSGGVALAGWGAGAAQADSNDHCSSRSGCYKGPGMRWCPGDYVWRSLVATGWNLSECHVYHSTFDSNNDPNGIAEGPGPAPLPVPTKSRPCPPISFHSCVPDGSPRPKGQEPANRRARHPGCSTALPRGCSRVAAPASAAGPRPLRRRQRCCRSGSRPGWDTGRPRRPDRCSRALRARWRSAPPRP